MSLASVSSVYPRFISAPTTSGSCGRSQHAHAVVIDLGEPRKIPFEEIGPLHRQNRRAFARFLGRQHVISGQAQPDQAAPSASARCGSTASAPEGRHAISASTP